MTQITQQQNKSILKKYWKNKRSNRQEQNINIFLQKKMVKVIY